MVEMKKHSKKRNGLFFHYSSFWIRQREFPCLRRHNIFDRSDMNFNNQQKNECCLRSKNVELKIIGQFSLYFLGAINEARFLIVHTILSFTLSVANAEGDCFFYYFCYFSHTTDERKSQVISRARVSQFHVTRHPFYKTILWSK